MIKFQFDKFSTLFFNAEFFNFLILKLPLSQPYFLKKVNITLFLIHKF